MEVGARRDPHALAAIAALARRENARLTLLAAIVRPPSLTWAAPFALPVDLMRAAHEECDARLRAAVESLPDDLSVTALIRHRRAERALLAELQTGAYDLAAVQSRRVARALLRRAHVPVLVVNREPASLATQGAAG